MLAGYIKILRVCRVINERYYEGCRVKSKTIGVLSLLALIATLCAGVLLHKDKILSEVSYLAEADGKLRFLLWLERPKPLTSPVWKVIKSLHGHMYSIRGKLREGDFSGCMMQAIKEMTGTVGLYIDLDMCG